MTFTTRMSFRLNCYETSGAECQIHAETTAFLEMLLLGKVSWTLKDNCSSQHVEFSTLNRASLLLQMFTFNGKRKTPSGQIIKLRKNCWARVLHRKQKEWGFCRCCMIHPFPEERNAFFAFWSVWAFCVCCMTCHIKKKKVKRPLYGCLLTVVVLSNDEALSESETAQQVRHQAVKWSWTEQNKQAGWCHSLMGTSVQTEEWSWEEVPKDARERESQTEREREREGRRERREGCGGRGFSEGRTARPLQLLHYWSSAKGEEGCVQRNTQWGNPVHPHTSKTARQHGCGVDLQPSGFDEARVFFLVFPSLLWFPHPALHVVDVCRANLSPNGRSHIVLFFSPLKHKTA